MILASEVAWDFASSNKVIRGNNEVTYFLEHGKSFNCSVPLINSKILHSNVQNDLIIILEKSNPVVDENSSTNLDNENILQQL